MAAGGGGCSSMMVCSKRGPTIACARGFWLRLHTPALLGACATRCASPASTDSWSVPDSTPCLEVGVALLADTFGGEGRDAGALAGMPPSAIRVVVEDSRTSGRRQMGNSGRSDAIVDDGAEDAVLGNQGDVVEERGRGTMKLAEAGSVARPRNR